MSAQSPVVAEAAREARARKGSEQRGAGGGEPGGPALPERRVGGQRQQQGEMHPHPVERPDRVARVGDAHVHVHRQRGFAARENARGLGDRAVAGEGSDDAVAPHGGRVGAGGRRPQPELPERLLQARAQVGELAHRGADPLVGPGGELHHGRVRLEAHPLAQVVGQLGHHLVRAVDEGPVAFVEEHQLLLDADRERRLGRAPPRRPRGEFVSHGTRTTCRIASGSTVATLGVPRAARRRGSAPTARRRRRTAHARADPRIGRRTCPSGCRSSRGG